MAPVGFHHAVRPTRLRFSSSLVTVGTRAREGHQYDEQWRWDTGEAPCWGQNLKPAVVGTVKSLVNCSPSGDTYWPKLLFDTFALHCVFWLIRFFAKVQVGHGQWRGVCTKLKTSCKYHFSWRMALDGWMIADLHGVAHVFWDTNRPPPASFTFD